MQSLKGAIVALVTPMDENGDIEWETLFLLIDMHVKAGISGIVLVGTTGESATIDMVEHIQIIEKCAMHIDKRINLIAGTGANSTKEALYLTSSALEAGADAVLLVTPYYNKPTQEGLYAHYSEIAESVDIKQILYNVPSRTGCDLVPDTVSRLSKHENIIGLKEASSEPTRINSLIQKVESVVEDNFLLFSGDDLTAIDFIIKGGHGTISVTANIVPEIIVESTKAALEGSNVDLALKLNSKLENLNKLLFIESNPIPVKWALMRMGKIGTGIRLPLTPLNKEFTYELESELKKLELI